MLSIYTSLVSSDVPGRNVILSEVEGALKISGTMDMIPVFAPRKGSEGTPERAVGECHSIGIFRLRHRSLIANGNFAQDDKDEDDSASYTLQ
jgi:hypothetical protein